MTILKVIILLLIFTPSYGQSNLISINNWKSYPVPKNEDSLNKYNFDPNNWIVSIDKNEVYVANGIKNSVTIVLPFEIKPSKEEERLFRGKRNVLEVGDGFLISFYRGEFGGNLYWFSKDGSKKYEISYDRIKQFKIRYNKIYAIEGLAHLTMSEGSIIEVKKESGKWITIEYLKLPSAPEFFEIDGKNNFVIVTSSGLISVDSKKKINNLIRAGIWDVYLNPSSLVIQNNNVFIGMRKAVFKYNLLTKKEEWLLPY